MIIIDTKNSCDTVWLHLFLMFVNVSAKIKLSFWTEVNLNNSVIYWTYVVQLTVDRQPCWNYSL